MPDSGPQPPRRSAEARITRIAAQLGGVLAKAGAQIDAMIISALEHVRAPLRKLNPRQKRSAALVADTGSVIGPYRRTRPIAGG
jgi:hypothetical protein